MSFENERDVTSRGTRILHVDDDPRFLETVAAFYAQALPAADVVTATSAAAGLDRLGDGQFHCIVSDYDMPGADGLEFLRETREEYPELPFVLYTGKGSEEIAAEAINAGVTGYLQKGGPDQHRRLVNRVDHAIEEFRAKIEAERYSRVLQALGYPMYVVDDDARFEYVNEAFVELTGYSRDELLGSSPSRIKTEESVRRANEALRSILSSSGPDTEQFEIDIVRKNGEHVPCQDHMAADVRDGEFCASVGILRDLCSQHRTRQELEEQNERLEEFVSVVSHDLRTPLQTATTATELARETGDPDHFERVEAAHDRMDRMLTELLTLARDGETPGRVERVDLGALASEVWETLRTGEHAMNVEAATTVEADPDRLRRLLENLVENAMTHADGPITVTVGDCEDGFYVADDGPGIPPGKREEMFEPGVTTAVDGTGFGLTIVRRITRAHGWEVALVDGTDGGARFEFTGVATAGDPHDVAPTEPPT